MSENKRRTHVFRHTRPVVSETKILERLPRGRLLDVGTAATGRSALVAAHLGYEVTSIDMNAAAVIEFAGDQRARPIQLAAADLQHLPFSDDHFDVVLIAFHGMDYIVEPHARQAALREVERVLKPDGYAIFDSYNPVGILLRRSTWRPPLRSRSLQYLFAGTFLRSRFVDMTGLELHQAIPRNVISEAQRVTGLIFDSAADADGNKVGVWRATMRSPEPYFVFRKT